jgi:hypothetical protein
MQGIITTIAPVRPPLQQASPFKLVDIGHHSAGEHP